MQGTFPRMTADIEDESAFRAWISHKLDPITNHDPRKTAAYVALLIKKNINDKTFDALKVLCRTKLQAFVGDRDQLEDFCDELVEATENHKYLEIRDHPSYADLLEETSPLTSSNKDRLKQERSRSPEQRIRTINSGEEEIESADEGIEDKPPVSSRLGILPPDGGSSSNSGPPLAVNRSIASRLSCKDFSERGFCMRGQYCPYDHGPDPVVWQNARPMEVLRYNAPPRVPPMPPQPVRLPGFPPLPMPPMIPPVRMPRFSPEAPRMPPFLRAPKTTNTRSRELIGLSSGPDRTLGYNEMFRGSDLTKRENDSTQDSPLKRLAMSETPKNCSLEIRNVPPQLNNISALNAHFSKYGNIVNVQVRYGPDQNGALVTFQTPDAAGRAFHSPEPVLNNRFIAISWHNEPVKETAIKMAGKIVPPPAPVLTPVAPKVEIKQEMKTEDSPPLNQSATTEEQAESMLASGFTRGVRVRYPVGSRRVYSARFTRGAVRGRGGADVVLPPGITLHQKLIYLNLEVSKTETEIEKVQGQITATEELAAKTTQSMKPFQQLSEQYRIKMAKEPNAAMNAELSKAVTKFDSQIETWQQELQKHEQNKLPLLKTLAALEERLKGQKQQVEVECGTVSAVGMFEDGSSQAVKSKSDEENASGVANGGSLEDGVDAMNLRPSADEHLRGSSARGTRGRGAYRTLRSPRRSSGAPRFRRPMRGGPFNRTVDRRPKRLKITSFPESERTHILDFVQASGGTVLDSPASDEIIVDFPTRYDGDVCLRDLPPSFAGRKVVTTWIAEEETVEIPAAEAAAGQDEFDVEDGENSGDGPSELQAVDSPAKGNSACALEIGEEDSIDLLKDEDFMGDDIL